VSSCMVLVAGCQVKPRQHSQRNLVLLAFSVFRSDTEGIRKSILSSS